MMTSSPARGDPTLSNEEQLWLMQQVKSNAMTIDEAVSWTEVRENELRNEVGAKANGKERILNNQHKNQFRPTKVLKTLLNKKSPRKSDPDKPLSKSNGNEDAQDTLSTIAQDLKNKKIYNFSIYKCAKNKSPQKRILQVDFDGKLLSLIHRGNITKAYPFTSFVSVDGQEGKKVFIHFDDGHELEVNAENLVDKTKLIRLLNIICEQNDHEERGEAFDPCEKLNLSFRVIKEGYLEKKGGYAALSWTKRLIVIRSGELAYYRIDEEEQSAALNIIHLSPGSIAIHADDSCSFTVATTKESHKFRLPENGPSLSCSQEKIRDEWIEALQKGCSRHSQQESSSSSSGEEEVCYEQVENFKTENKTDSFDIIFQEMEKLKNSLNENNNRKSEISAAMDRIRMMLSDIRSTSSEQEDTKTIPSLPSSKSSSVKSSAAASVRSQEPREDSPVYQQIRHRSAVISSSSPPPMAFHRKTSKNSDRSQRVTSLEETLVVTSDEIVLETRDEPANQKTLTTVGGASPEKRIDSGEPLGAAAVESPELKTLLDDVFTADENPYSLAGDAVPVIKDSTPPPPPPPTPAQHPDQRHSGAASVSTPRASRESGDLQEQDSKKPQTADAVLLSNEKGASSFAYPPVRPAPPVPGIPPPPPFSGASLSSIPPPPPPGMSNGIPPPPPPSSSCPMSPSSLAVETRRDKIAMRPFHWQTIPKQMITKSMWKNVEDLSDQIDNQELVEMFQTTNDKKGVNSATSTPLRVQVLPTDSTPKRKATESYLDHKTAQNLGIFMAGFKFRGEELVRKLSVIGEEDGGFSTEQIIGLRKFCPEPELKAIYAKHEGREEELSKVDRFMAELCTIPRMGTRLEILSTLRELPQEIETLQPEVDVALSACHELLESKLFETLLAYLLAVANQINATNSKGITKGIRLSSLQKTCVMRTNDRKQTLLQVVLRIVKRSAPQVLHLPQEMSSLSKSQSYSTKGLQAEIDIMRKSVIKVRKSCDVLRRKKNHPTKEDIAFCSEAEIALASMESSINQLSERCMEIKRIAGKVMIKFGESPDSDSQEFFGHVREFLDNFKKSLPPP